MESAQNSQDQIQETGTDFCVRELFRRGHADCTGATCDIFCIITRENIFAGGPPTLVSPTLQPSSLYILTSISLGEYYPQ